MNQTYFFFYNLTNFLYVYDVLSELFKE